MIKKNFRHALGLVLFLLVCTLSFGQEQFTITSLNKVPQSSYANPALVPTHLKFFIGIPALSGIQFSGYSQGFTLKDMGLTKLFNPEVDYDLARNNLSTNNTYRFGGNVDLLYAGVANKSGVFTFNFTERLLGEVNLPRDLFNRLGDETQRDSLVGRMYDLSGFSTQALHFKELGIGYATQKRRGVNWGIRLKFLLGHEAIYSENDGLMLREDANGSLSREGSFAFKTAGFRHFAAGENLFRLFSARNAGVAVDAGFHYRYNKRWEFYGSIRDLGGITWRKSLNLRETPGNFADLESEIEDTFESLVNDNPEITKSFRTALPTQLRGGMRYHLKKNRELNIIASTRFYPSGADFGLSFAYYQPVTPWLDWTASYSVFNETYTNIGTGLAVQIGKLQLYFATDNVFSAFSPTGGNTFHFQSGINLVWKKPDKKTRQTANRETIKPEDPMVSKKNGYRRAGRGCKLLYP